MMNEDIKSHFEELRKRLIKCVIVFIISMAIGLTISKEGIRKIQEGINTNTTNIILSSPMQSISAYIEFAMMISLVVTIPYMTYQTYQFISPAMTEEQIKILKRITPISSILFIIGIVIGHVIAKTSLNFLMGFSGNMALETYWNISGLISYMVFFPIAVGLIFQMPIITAGLIQADLIKKEMIGRYRKYAIIGTLLIAGFITPSTDMMTQIMLALPIYLLYEGTNIINKIIFR